MRSAPGSSFFPQESPHRPPVLARTSPGSAALARPGLSPLPSRCFGVLPSAARGPGLSPGELSCPWMEGGFALGESFHQPTILC